MDRPHRRAVGGLAWAASLRAFMWEVAGFDAGVDVVGTFVWVLLPRTIIGALLAWGEHRRWSGPVPHRRWLIWSPMLFVAVLVHNPLDLVSGFEGGIGLAAIAVPAICMAGGYGFGGRGPAWLRAVGLLVLAATIPAWSLSAESVGGARMSLSSPYGAWAAVLYWGLLTTFALAAAVPHRRPVARGQSAASSPEASSESPSTTTTA